MYRNESIMVGKNVQTGDFIAYIYLILVSVNYGFINTDFEIRGAFSTVLTIGEVILFVVWLFSQRFSAKWLAGIAALGAISISTYIATSETVFLIMILTGVIFTKLDYVSGLKVVFVSRIFDFVVILFCVAFGVLDVNKDSVMKGQLGGSFTVVSGYGLGYHHPNQLASTVLLLILLYLCIKRGQLKLSELFAVIVVVFATVEITRNRTITILIPLEVVLLLLLNSAQFKNKTQLLFDVVGKWVMPVCALLSIVPALLMNTVTGRAQVILYNINGLMGSRYTHSARVFENYPVPLFGGISDFGELEDLYKYSTVDNGYVRLLYNFGIVGFAVFLLLYWMAISNMLKRGEYIFLSFIFIVSIWGLSESVLRSFAFNFTVVFLV
ncbi:O-antigen ligase like membrane protein [Bifidobacterium thermophilum]|nr:O-antigen ligase like membrane protein [Bifidobacterium thermophilum]